MKPNPLAVLAISSMLALAAFAPSANADERYRDGYGWDRERDGGEGRRYYSDHPRQDYRGDYRYARDYERPRYRRVDGPDYRPGPPPHAWVRGQRYYDYYRGPVYVLDDYPRYHLRRPPHGHRWVRDDRGNMLMVAIATGIIADVILHH